MVTKLWLTSATKSVNLQTCSDLVHTVMDNSVHMAKVTCNFTLQSTP